MSVLNVLYFFFFNDTATTEIYTLSLHDALPISIPVGIGSVGWKEKSLSGRLGSVAGNQAHAPKWGSAHVAVLFPDHAAPARGHGTDLASDFLWTPFPAKVAFYTDTVLEQHPALAVLTWLWIERQRPILLVWSPAKSGHRATSYR